MIKYIDEAKKKHTDEGKKKGYRTFTSWNDNVREHQDKVSATKKAVMKNVSAKKMVDTQRQTVSTKAKTNPARRKQLADISAKRNRENTVRAAKRLARGKGGAATLARAEGTSFDVQKYTGGKNLQELIDARRRAI